MPVKADPFVPGSLMRYISLYWNLLFGVSTASTSCDWHVAWIVLVELGL